MNLSKSKIWELHIKAVRNMVEEKFTRYHLYSVLINISVLLAFNLFDNVFPYHDDFLSRLLITGEAIPQDVQPFKEESHAQFSILLPPKDRLEIIHHFMPVCCINAWNANNTIFE